MNKEPNPETPSRFSGFVTSLIIAGVAGAAIFVMPLLHDALVGSTPTSNPFHWALVGGGITFIGLLAFLQLPTKLFVYVIPVLVLLVAFLPAEGPELKDLAVQPEVPAIVQPEAVLPIVVQPAQPEAPAVVQPEGPVVVPPDTTVVQPEVVTPPAVVEPEVPIDGGHEVPQPN